ncbi:MAG: hypothetical protein V1778_05050 [bacterium]
MADVPRPKKSPRLKFTALLLLVVLVFAFFLPFFAEPKPAQALPGEALAAQVWAWMKKRVDDAIAQARKTSADIAFKNALKVYTTKLAQDTATWIASAGTGQKPLFITDPHYFKNLTDAAAGQFLDTMATKNLGVDVCKTPNLKTQFSIESAVRALVDPANWCQNQCKAKNTAAENTDTFIVGEGVFMNIQIVVTLPEAQNNLDTLNGAVAADDTILDIPGGAAAFPTICDPAGTVRECINVYTQNIATYKRVIAQNNSLCLNLCSANVTVARCTLSQIEAEVNNVGHQLKNKDFIPKITKTFEPGENDIGQIITLAEKAKDAAQEKLQQDQAIRGNSDVQPVTDKITGKVKTPASLTSDAAKQGLTKDPSGGIFSIQTGSPLADTIGVFTNTLTKALLKRIFSQGFNPETNPQTQFGNISGGGLGIQTARDMFSSLADTDFSTGGASATLADLTACPTESPGPNNCAIDEGFRQAIEQGMTVKEAVDAGKLHADWPVGFQYSDGAKNNVEPNYKQGYPYRSILILRRLRILPVGWELAAEYMKDYDPLGSTQTQRSLGALLTAYAACDGTSPSVFCGLIDPNWVLKSPETLCRFSGATAALTSLDYFPDPLYPDAPQIPQIGRVNACVDEQTCLQEDDKGNCTAYGYCTQERPSWKFGGQKCTPSYHSCDTYVDPQNAEFSYLSTTLDYNDCTATNAGCQWYCRDYNATTAQYTCTPTSGNKEQFTSKVRTCAEPAAGCTEYLRTTNTTNLTANGSFETLSSGDVADDGTQDTFPGWVSTGVSAWAVSTANSGAIGAKIDGNPNQQLQNAIDTKMLLNGQSTTLSFYGRADGASCTGYFGMKTTTGAGDYLVKTPVTFTGGWQRFTTTLTYDPLLTYTSSTVTSFFEVSTCAAILDDVQTEFGNTFSPYKEYGSMNKIYLNGERRSCRQEEVGCDLYSSATDTIPGVATTADFCPADQVGCRAFLEVPVNNNGANPAFPARTGMRCSQDQSRSCATNAECSGAGSCLPSVSLVPKTGTTCSAASVGCEEYTNLDEVARGGEGKEYYTYIRECVKPTGDPSNEKTFYTWIGNQQTGFQLKAYLLKPTSTAYTGPGDTIAGGPAYNSATSTTDPNLCTAAIFSAGDNPDCRQFYDATLNIYYRLYTKTVSVSDDCHPLRNTLDTTTYYAIPSEGITCPASAAQCREYRGSSGFNTRTILTDNFNDGDTLGWNGAQWSTESLIFGGGSAFSGGTLETNADSHVSQQLAKGRSYIVTFWAGAGNSASNNKEIKARLTNSPASESFEGTAKIRWDASVSGPQWNFYTLGPLHLDRDPITTVGSEDNLQFFASGGGSYFIDNIKLYEVADNLYMIKGSAKLCTGNENCDLYHNREGKSFTLKGFTRLCSEERVGCEALINTQNSDSPFAQTFMNPNGNGSTKTVPGDVIDLVVNDPKYYCREEEQGCTKLGRPTFDTSGFYCSNDPTKQCSQNADCTTPTGSGTCGFVNAPVNKYDTIYLVNDPDEYATTLCWSQEVGCEQWKSKTTGETTYFHRPEPNTCELKTVTMSNQNFTDWYRSGTSGLNPGDTCPTVSPAPAPAQNISPVIPYTQPTGFCENNTAVRCSTDAQCGGMKCVRMVGICPAEQAGCKEYRDTNDPAQCWSDCLLTVDQKGKKVPVNAQCAIDNSSALNGCQGYWYLRQSVESNAEECNGAVNNEQGCRQFYSPDT